MNKIRIDYYQLDSMKRFYPKTSFINTESKLYFFNDAIFSGTITSPKEFVSFLKINI